MQYSGDHLDTLAVGEARQQALDACKEVRALVDSLFLITGCEFHGHEKGDCVLMLGEKTATGQALGGHIGILQLRRLFANIERQALQGNPGVMDCTFLDQPADPVTFTGYRVRYVDGLKCLSAVRKHFERVCAAVEGIEDTLRCAIVTCRSEGAPPPPRLCHGPRGGGRAQLRLKPPQLRTTARVGGRTRTREAVHPTGPDPPRGSARQRWNETSNTMSAPEGGWSDSLGVWGPRTSSHTQCTATL